MILVSISFSFQFEKKPQHQIYNIYLCRKNIDLSPIYHFQTNYLLFWIQYIDNQNPKIVMDLTVGEVNTIELEVLVRKEIL